MKKYIYNNELGNRGRECKTAVIHENIIYTPDGAEKNNLAVFKELDYTKNGKWSNSTYEVTLNSASLIVCMSPFDGFSDDLQDCIEHIKNSCEGYIGYIPTTDEALLFLQVKYPKTYARVTEKEKLTSELI
jgi:hypothetical protein